MMRKSPAGPLFTWTESLLRSGRRVLESMETTVKRDAPAPRPRRARRKAKSKAKRRS